MASPTTGIGQAPAMESALPFRSAGEHLLAELDYLRLLLHRQVLRLRAASLLRDDQFRGLYISDEEVDAILRQSSTGSQSGSAGEPSPVTARELAAQIESVSAELASRLHASQSIGVELPLPRLARMFSLSRFEQFALLTCVAPEIDRRFETLYAYVQNDVTRRCPTPDLIFSLFTSSVPESLTLRPLLSPWAALFHLPLLHFVRESQEREAGFLSRPLRAEERVVNYLLDQTLLDERLRSFVEVRKPSQSFDVLRLPPALAKKLQRLGSSFETQGGVVFLHGLKGSGKRSVAEAVSLGQHRLLLVARLERLLLERLPLPQAIQLLEREAHLLGANLLLVPGESLWDSDPSASQKRKELLRILDPGSVIVFVSVGSPCLPAEIAAKCAVLSFSIPAPDFSQRASLWGDAIRATGRESAADVDVHFLANKFRLTGGEIHRACREAAVRAVLRDPCGPISLGDIDTAARSQSNPGLRRLASKVEPIHDWPDLVLPPRCIRQLREVCAAEHFRHVVYSQWGFDRRLSQGRGLNVLFCGPSGTGKTMAAGIVARALALDLYKIDLSTVVSKYIGETEKQLSQIFREAGSSNAILFFDEADALFGKRSEVKDAHDRYANVEVAYLLQKMEEYEGVVILATNLRRNIDDAFTRRMNHIVEFPFPDAGLRERIWKGMVPSAAPVAPDVNFAFLARQFELSGGNIRNVALAAAFLAAEAGGQISMEHYILGTAREMQKLGKIPSRSEFREYYELLHSAN